MDYASGAIDIQPNQLLEFIGVIRKNNICLIGTIEDRRQITTSIKIDPPLAEGSEVLFRPKYNQERNHTWVEGFVKEGDKEKLVVNRRIYRGSKRPEDRFLYEWKGTDIQAIIDWVEGKLDIKNVNSVRISLKDGFRIDLQVQEGSIIRFDLRYYERLSLEDDIVLAPRANPIKRIEIYKVIKDSDNNDQLILEEKPLATFKVREHAEYKLKLMRGGLDNLFNVALEDIPDFNLFLGDIADQELRQVMLSENLDHLLKEYPNGLTLDLLSQLLNVEPSAIQTKLLEKVQIGQVRFRSKDDTPVWFDFDEYRINYWLKTKLLHGGEVTITYSSPHNVKSVNVVSREKTEEQVSTDRLDSDLDILIVYQNAYYPSLIKLHVKGLRINEHGKVVSNNNLFSHILDAAKKEAIGENALQTPAYKATIEKALKREKIFQDDDPRNKSWRQAILPYVTELPTILASIADKPFSLLNLQIAKLMFFKYCDENDVISGLIQNNLPSRASVSLKRWSPFEGRKEHVRKGFHETVTRLSTRTMREMIMLLREELNGVSERDFIIQGHDYFPKEVRDAYAQGTLTMGEYVLLDPYNFIMTLTPFFLPTYELSQEE